MRTPLPILAATLGAVALGAAAVAATICALAAREARICAAAGDADPTPADLGAAEARDHMRWCDPDGAW